MKTITVRFLCSDCRNEVRYDQATCDSCKAAQPVRQQFGLEDVHKALNPIKPTIREVAQMAIDIHNKWSEAADRDAGFDGGEFSGPASSRMCDKEIEQLSKDTGFTVREIENEMNVLCLESDFNSLTLEDFK